MIMITGETGKRRLKRLLFNAIVLICLAGLILSPFNVLINNNQVILADDSIVQESSYLDEFEFATIPSPQFAGISFPINIRAVDQFGNTLTSFTGKADLYDLYQTINPTQTTNFIAGVWSGNVTITTPRTGIRIYAR